MDNRLRRVLILDTDPDTLMALQYVLEQAEIDTAITWDEAEACQLLESKSFDLLVIGDHPPELDAASILQDLSYRGTCPTSLILRDVVREKDTRYFRGLGAIGVFPRGDPLVFLEEVTGALAPMLFKATPAKEGRTKGRALRTAC